MIRGITMRNTVIGVLVFWHFVCFTYGVEMSPHNTSPFDNWRKIILQNDRAMTCKTALKKPKIPTETETTRINNLVRKLAGLKEEFIKHCATWKGSLPDSYNTELKAALELAQSFTLRFEFDVVVNAGLVELFENLSSVLNYRGNVPEPGELQKLEEELLHRAETLIQMPRPIAEEQVSSWKLDASILQQIEAIERLVRPNSNLSLNFDLLFEKLEALQQAVGAE